jgi:hypothetical protein
LVIELVLLILSKQSLFIMTPMLLVLNHTGHEPRYSSPFNSLRLLVHLNTQQISNRF